MNISIGDRSVNVKLNGTKLRGVRARFPGHGVLEKSEDLEKPLSSARRRLKRLKISAVPRIARKPAPNPAVELIEVMIAGLAVSRMARLVVDDEITRPIREKVTNHWPDSPVVTLIGCRACTSVWGAGLMMSGLVPRKIRLILAFSEVAVIIERLVDNRGQADSGWE